MEKQKNVEIEVVDQKDHPLLKWAKTNKDGIVYWTSVTAAGATGLALGILIGSEMSVSSEVMAEAGLGDIADLNAMEADLL
jgi:purine-cytosine permease-like protein